MIPFCPSQHNHYSGQRSKSIEIPLNWAKLNMHQLPGTQQTPCLPSSLLIIYMHVSLVLCKMAQERKLLQLLSWDCQDGCIPTAMSIKRFCWREDFGVGIRSFWRMMLPLSPGKRWWKNKHLAILTPLSQTTQALGTKLSQLCDTGSCFKRVQNIMHLRRLAEGGESNYTPGLV